MNWLKLLTSKFKHRSIWCNGW